MRYWFFFRGENIFVSTPVQGGKFDENTGVVKIAPGHIHENTHWKAQIASASRHLIYVVAPHVDNQRRAIGLAVFSVGVIAPSMHNNRPYWRANFERRERRLRDSAQVGRFDRGSN